MDLTNHLKLQGGQAFVGFVGTHALTRTQYYAISHHIIHHFAWHCWVLPCTVYEAFREPPHPNLCQMLPLFVHLVTSSLDITMYHIICVLPTHVLSNNMCHLSFCLLKGRVWCFQRVYLTPKQKESPSAGSCSLITHPQVRPCTLTRIYGYSTLYGYSTSFGFSTLYGYCT